MADGMDVSELVRRTIQANAKFYKGWVDLSLEYIRGLSEIFGAAEPQAAAAAADAASAADSGAGVLVLEGEDGTTVRGAFLVSNDLGRKLSCELYASEFSEPGGARTTVRVAFDPPTVELAPGEQRVVYASVPVEGALAPGRAYTGTFAIKDLPGFSVPVVLRRRFGLEEPAGQDQPAAEQRAPQTGPKPRAPRGGPMERAQKAAPKQGAGARRRKPPGPKP